MRITIRQLKLAQIPSNKGDGIYCAGASENEILFVFTPPNIEAVHIGDIIELDPHILGKPQTVLNITTSVGFTTQLNKQDIHDLRLPPLHGKSRFPSLERLNEV
jgi:hypothetical protein